MADERRLVLTAQSAVMSGAGSGLSDAIAESVARAIVDEKLEPAVVRFEGGGADYWIDLRLVVSRGANLSETIAAARLRLQDLLASANVA